jgi:hypothetical protein
MTSPRRRKQPHWQGRESEAVELALLTADEARNFEPGQPAASGDMHKEDVAAFKNAREIAAAAGDAQRAIDHLLEKLHGDVDSQSPNAVWLTIAILSTYRADGLSETERGAMRETDALQLRPAAARLETHMREAAKIAAELAARAESRRKDLQADQQNVGRTHDQDLAEIWARFWVDITGALPGQPNDHATGPFGRFLRRVSGRADFSSSAVNIGIQKILPRSFETIARDGLAAWLAGVGEPG